MMKSNMQMILDKADRLLCFDSCGMKTGSHRIEPTKRKTPIMCQMLDKANHLLRCDSFREDAIQVTKKSLQQQLNTKVSTQSKKGGKSVIDLNVQQMLDKANHLFDFNTSREDGSQLTKNRKKGFADLDDLQVAHCVTKLRSEEYQSLHSHTKQRRMKTNIQLNMQQMLDKANDLFGLDSQKEDDIKVTKKRKSEFAELDSMHFLDKAYCVTKFGSEKYKCFDIIKRSSKRRRKKIIELNMRSKCWIRLMVYFAWILKVRKLFRRRKCTRGDMLIKKHYSNYRSQFHSIEYHKGYSKMR